MAISDTVFRERLTVFQDFATKYNALARLNDLRLFLSKRLKNHGERESEQKLWSAGKAE
jgi:hypothetical protein